MMILHYIKMAIRNLRKYALQNTVSILGLAAGFVALSLSAYWYRFDTTYDKFHKDWERIYTLSGNIHVTSGNISYSPMPEKYINNLLLMPENESVITCKNRGFYLGVNKTFMNTMGYEIIAGDSTFLEKPGYCAISETFSKLIFGDDDPIGKTIMNSDINKTKQSVDFSSNEPFSKVGAVFRGSNHSYLNFDIFVNDIISSNEGNDVEIEYGKIVFVKIRPGIELDKYKEKIATINTSEFEEKQEVEFTNISQLHSQYKAGPNAAPMDLKHIKLFALISLLLVICSVVNCLTLFMSRISGRRKEMGLRIANGSSLSDLLKLLSIDLILQFLIALTFAILIVFFIKDGFSEYARIGGVTMNIVWSCFAIMLLVLFLSVIVGMVILAFSLKGSLISAISSSRLRNRTIRRLGISIQLFISIFCVFCTLSILNQLNFLRNADWGFGIKGYAAIEFDDYQTLHDIKEGLLDITPEQASRQIVDIAASRNEFVHKLSSSLNALPGVIEAKPSYYSFMASTRGSSSYRYYVAPSIDSLKVEGYDLGIFDIGNSAYGFNVLEGALPESNLAYSDIVISESVCRTIGLENPIGKKLYRRGNGGFNEFTIVAVISDLYIKGPLADPTPIVFSSFESRQWSLPDQYYKQILIRYNSDVRKELFASIYNMLDEGPSKYKLSFLEDWFADYLKPAANLCKLFTIIAITCMLISVFGVWSIITLTCQERRREIAVRKVHGAKVRDILTIFVREYGAVLLMTSVVAFGVGYVVMHKWIQQFQKQAVISWWIYAVILLGMAAIISLTVVQRIIKTARENPADVIKSE